MTAAGLMLCPAIDPRRTALAMGAAVALLAALGYAVVEDGSLRAAPTTTQTTATTDTEGTGGTPPP
jgi:hypothetical protein